MDSERFTDDMAPRLVAEAPGYSKTPAGPTRKAALVDRDGVLLGYVWTDDGEAAGWLPGEATAASARAGAFVWRVLSVQHQRGKPARYLLDPRLFAPLYTLDPAAGEPALPDPTSLCRRLVLRRFEDVRPDSGGAQRVPGDPGDRARQGRVDAAVLREQWGVFKVQPAQRGLDCVLVEVRSELCLQILHLEPRGTQALLFPDAHDRVQHRVVPVRPCVFHTSSPTRTRS